MADFTRIAIRTAAYAAVFAALAALLFLLYKLFALIPVQNFDLVISAFRVGLWFVHRFVPPLIWTVGFVAALIAFKFAVYAAYLVNLAASWILRVFQ